MPYTTHYYNNGTGRDSYIHMDNGGFFAKYEPAKAPDLGTFGSPSKKFSYPMSRVPAKHVFYTSNGTGRDGYIGLSNGGFYPEQPVAAYK